MFYRITLIYKFSIHAYFLWDDDVRIIHQNISYPTIIRDTNNFIKTFYTCDIILSIRHSMK